MCSGNCNGGGSTKSFGKGTGSAAIRGKQPSFINRDAPRMSQSLNTVSRNTHVPGKSLGYRRK